MSKFSNKLRTTLKAAKKNYEVLQYINKKVEHHIIIDSSKNPIRGRLLFELDNTTKFIYLKRDGRGITNSWAKAYKFSFKYSLFQWILRDLLVKLYILFIPQKNILMIRYEEFCKDPKNVLMSITNFIGVSYDEKLLESNTTNRHDIHVNQNSLASMNEIQLDEKWRYVLNNEQLKTFNLFGGIYNRLNGYLK